MGEPDSDFKFILQTSDSYFRLQIHTSDFRLQTLDFRLQTSDFRLRTPDSDSDSDSDFGFGFRFRIQISDFRFRFQISDFGFRFRISSIRSLNNFRYSDCEYSPTRQCLTNTLSSPEPKFFL
ncbi:hypothetical protein A2U01_0052445 [Trifolium medium]|uniref:Uncharacterized protein n=1 Tax=Trifolium medium TaxID=97028 RepID=A0A392R3U3_9FABA|nr:hypothetical protein [Trifolium medium]